MDANRPQSCIVDIFRQSPVNSSHIFIHNALNMEIFRENI